MRMLIYVIFCPGVIKLGLLRRNLSGKGGIAVPPNG